MKFFRLISILNLLPVFLFSQDPVIPAAKNNYSSVTSYEELSGYVELLDKQSDLLKLKIIGQSVQGRNLYGLEFSSSKFGKDASKIRVMIFAQQHGNEQSGKEGALMLASELLKEENHYLFDRIDLLLVPQVNPDGSEINERKNANGMDLNRNHLILTEPETRALHDVFDRYLFEVSMDVHEYYPYIDEWINYGYRKNSEITVGITTNVNVSKQIRDISALDYLPFIFNYLKEKEFSVFEYCPGGPPGINYIRHSTFDINDGRQSLGIQNTLSFIQEGMNGNDSYVENLERRTEGQYYGMRGLLEYAYLNKDKIKELVAAEREKLIAGNDLKIVSIQSEHTGNGRKLSLPLFSYYSGKDTIVEVEDYRPVVRTTYDVNKPVGYLVPKQMAELTDWIKRHSLTTGTYKKSANTIVEQYFTEGIDSLDFEGDPTVNPQVSIKEIQDQIDFKDYVFIPANQLKGNLVIQALEVKSTLGLITYRNYAHLVKVKEAYPVLKVVE